MTSNGENELMERINTLEKANVRVETKLDMHCESNDKDLSEIKAGIIRIETKIDLRTEDLEKKIIDKTDKSEFVIWRNWLVFGIGTAILLAILSLLLDRYFN